MLHVLTWEKGSNYDTIWRRISIFAEKILWMIIKHCFFHIVLWLVLLTGCVDSSRQQMATISVTIEPQRYFVERIAGTDFQVNSVIPAGQSPETYDPTPKQMMEIGNSMAYFKIGYIGFEQAWMKSLEKQNPNMQVFDLSKGMALIENHENGHHHHGAIDPHIWTSVGGVKVMAKNIRDALITLNPEYEARYMQRYDSLMREINNLEILLKQRLEPVKGSSFIIYHPTLTYFAQEFGLNQLCIELDGKEPSPAQLKELIETARHSQAKVVFVQQEFDQKNAELIANETGCRLVRINPLAYDWKQEILNLAKWIAGDEEQAD